MRYKLEVALPITPKMGRDFAAAQGTLRKLCYYAAAAAVVEAQVSSASGATDAHLPTKLTLALLYIISDLLQWHTIA
eukprot:1359111-Amphidinium_carterae.1